VVVFLVRLSVGPLGPFFKEELNLSSAQVGLVLSIAAFGYLLTQIPVGLVADKIGARWPIAIGEIIAGCAMISLYFVSSYFMLMALILLTGMGCGFLAPSTTQAVIVWFPVRERATVMGFKQTAVNIGGIIGAATLPAVAVAMGWRFGFLLLGVIAVGIGIISLLLYKNPPDSARSIRKDNKSHAAIVPLKEIVKNKEIWKVAMGVFFLNWIEMAMIGHFLIYLNKSLLFPVVAAGGLLAMAETAGAIARPVSGLVSDRIFGGRRKPVFIFFAVTASAMCLLLGLFGSRLLWAIYPVIFVLGIGAVGFGGIALTLLSELGGRGGAAKAAALGNSIGMGGSILGPPLFGYIVDTTSSYPMAWLSLAIVGAICVFILFSIKESERRI
jgi:sugar phosphate permease